MNRIIFYINSSKINTSVNHIIIYLYTIKDDELSIWMARTTRRLKVVWFGRKKSITENNLVTR